MSVTLKPYPEYKSSGAFWLGKVPAHWTLVPAFSVFREQNIRNIGMAERQVLSLSYGRIIKKSDDSLHGLVPVSFETYQIIEPGNIILRLTDLQNDQRSLRVGLARDRGIITSAYTCLQPGQEILSDFAYYYLHAADVQKVFYSMGSGLRQSMSFNELRRLPVVLPSRQEQQHTVEFLKAQDKHVNRYISAKRREIELLNEQKHAMIFHLLAVTVRNSEIQQSGTEWPGEIPGHWRKWRIKHFAKVGNGSTPRRSNTAYWSDHGYPWLNSGSVNQSEITSANQYVTEAALRECHLPRVSAGSVLIGITGQGKTRGKAAILRSEATINQHIAYITLQSPIISPEFLQLELMAAYQELRRISDDSGSTKGALTCEVLKQFRVAVPPSEEQSEIVSKARLATQQLESAIKRAQREIELIREYRTRLITDVVTGKLDVRGIEVPEFDIEEATEPVEAEPADELEAIEEEEPVAVQEGEDAGN